MYRPISEARLHFLLLVHLLASVTALEVTYPKIGTIYPTKGPLDVQWQSNDDLDPTELAIYLATYSGQTLKSEQRCIVATIDDGSTAITLSQPPPQGDSWTWMFYDNDLIISLGNNYIAQSVHFQFQSATPTPTPIASAGSSSKGLSPGIAAAIGVGGTLVVVALGLFVGYCCFYRRRQQKKRETISALPYTPGHRYSKQELDSKPGTAHGPPLSSSSNPPSYAGIKEPAQHEMEVYPSSPSTPLSSGNVVSPGAELSVNARHSHLPRQHVNTPSSPWSELAPSPARHEMYHDPHRAFPQELP
ncbi:uncharacterized protein Z520_08518 [Fonsecaea multimorphosa CBS 102226]|uniref:Mid2 domain-containing protein n=1 Tax=Fonsecaea multimorphosa CBS 102226 TaxID=1442371 RepID=A0A0D2H1W4_9EURO|nr:uncharacterized protein Z520_08518 [Fonsecaea multimorphosa CBS 102226]KIX95810.1 hypothetical protein Z520_08518 [Fonsecaea multimorphosa CBS 102226]OAL21546.1 hypothetical protein AYO22_07942 [Fonsecaea multimorphosa]